MPPPRKLVLVGVSLASFGNCRQRTKTSLGGLFAAPASNAKKDFKSPVSTNSTTPATDLATLTVFVGQIQASIIEIDLILMNQKLQLRHGIYWAD